MKAGTMVGQGLKKVRTEIFSEQFGHDEIQARIFKFFHFFFVQNLIGILTGKVDQSGYP